MTGGREEESVSAQTYVLDLQCDKWQTKPFPKLNEARFSHSSVGLGEQCYIACGMGDDGGFLSSIEMLRLGAEAWELIVISDLTPRVVPIFTRIDTNKIIILGGLDYE